MYVGYMYGSEGSLENNRLNTTNAPIKQKTDEWYSKTLNIKTDSKENTYDKYVSRTAIYCNDRSTDSYSSNSTMYYGAYKRLVDAKSPSYKCGNDASRNLYSTANVADKFSASTTKGRNGKLQYPIAQITADEIAYAGGKTYTNAQAWYYYNSINESVVGSNWWTMSASVPDNVGYVTVFSVNSSGNLEGIDAEKNIGIRPVMSLKSCVQVSEGHGSSNTPYEVSVDSTCASLEN